MTAQVDFTMVRGDTKKLSATLTDENGAVVNLTGASIRWWLAKTVTAAARILDGLARNRALNAFPAATGRASSVPAPSML